MFFMFYVVSAYLTAELITGIIHWFEDRYGNPDWPIIGKHVIGPNILHHKSPSAFCRGSYWNRNYTTLVPALVVAVIAFACSAHWVALVALFASQANEIHSWAHRRCNRLIRGLQRLGICQSPRHHSVHHRSPFNTNFCVMTNFLNPVLNFLCFFPILEFCLGIVNINPRTERERG